MKDEHNEHNVIERPETPKEAALAQVAALRKDMSEGWGWEKRAQVEYQKESTPWLELPLGDDDQQAVTEFVKRLLVL